MAEKAQHSNFPTSRVQRPQSTGDGTKKRTERIEPNVKAPFQVRGAKGGTKKILDTLGSEEQFGQLQQLYDDVNEELDEEALKTLQAEPPEQPSFPYAILMAAMIKDILDALTGGFFSFIISILLSGIIWLWLLGKVGMAQKQLVRWAVKRGLVFAVLDSTPIIAAFPFATLFVILAHYRETKTVQLLFWALEKAKGEHLFEVKKTRANLSNTVSNTI